MKQKMISFKLVLTLAAVSALVSQMSEGRLSPFGGPPGAAMDPKWVRETEILVAGNVDRVHVLDRGRAVSDGTTFQGKWQEASIVLDHVIKGTLPKEIKVVFFTPDSGSDQLYFSDLKVGSRYLLCLVEDATKEGRYQLPHPIDAVLKLADDPPPGLHAATTFAEHLELELIRVLNFPSSTTKINIIYVIRSLQLDSPTMMKALRGALQDTNARVREAAEDALRHFGASPDEE